MILLHDLSLTYKEDGTSNDQRLYRNAHWLEWVHPGRIGSRFACTRRAMRKNMKAFTISPFCLYTMKFSITTRSRFFWGRKCTLCFPIHLRFIDFIHRRVLNPARALFCDEALSVFAAFINLYHCSSASVWTRQQFCTSFFTNMDTKSIRTEASIVRVSIASIT